MFRAREADDRVAFTAAAGLVVAIHGAALVLAGGCAAALLWEERLFRGRAVGDPSAWAFRRLTLVLLGATLAAAALQVAGLAAFWRLRRRYLHSRASLHRVKSLAHDILASMEQGVITVDGADRVTSINTGAIRLLGLDFDGVGQPLERISSEAVPLAELSRRVAERRAPVRDLEIATHGGTRRLVAHVHDLRDPCGRPLGRVIHLRDVTERMLLKEQMWRMQQFAGLSTLASGLHHEIKNPLTALSIHVQLLEERLRGGPGWGVAEEPVGVLKAEARRLTGVLERFRDFASLQRLEPGPADGRAILERVARLIGPQAQRQGVAVALGPDPPAPAGAEIDAEKIEQAILNLVLNALEAMPGGGTLALSAATEGGVLRVEVGDTGPGIPPELREHLFEPYFSTKSRGTGMGLALAEKLVGQHGGSISFRTGPDGTTFRIDVPARAAGSGG